MSTMKEAANQSSSVGMAKIMTHVRVTGGRNADFTRRSENDLAPIAGIWPIYRTSLTETGLAGWACKIRTQKRRRKLSL